MTVTGTLNWADSISIESSSIFKNSMFPNGEVSQRAELNDDVETSTRSGHSSTISYRGGMSGVERHMSTMGLLEFGRNTIKPSLQYTRTRGQIDEKEFDCLWEKIFCSLEDLLFRIVN